MALLKVLLMASALTVTAVVVKTVVKASKPDVAIVDEDETIVKTSTKKKKNPARIPASREKNTPAYAAPYRPSFVERERDPAIFNDQPLETAGEGAGASASIAEADGGGGGEDEGLDNVAAAPPSVAPTPAVAPTKKPETTKPPLGIPAPSTLGAGFTSFFGSGAPVLTKAPTPAPAPTPTIAPRTETLSCTADYGSGAYNQALNVKITCSSAADIKYCLGIGSCCEPNTDYTAPVVVGTTDNDFCLSYTGLSISSRTLSARVDNNYHINTTLPDVQTAVARIQYQTTELQSSFSLTSNDFGTSNFTGGVINFKSNDPSSWTCDQQVEDYASVPAPAPVFMMPDTDTSGFTVSTQLDVFLNTTNMAYGPNYIVSYMKNDDPVAPSPVYACASSIITLEDFPYFEANPNHGIAGTATVQEFSGGFTHLGFFEPAATVYRGPASGSDSETVSDEKLGTGLFGILF